MEPIRFDGPSLELGVRRRLRRLDKQLRVTFAPVSIDPVTGVPLRMSGRLDPYTGERLAGCVEDPHFDLWRKDPYSSHHFYIRSYGPRFGHWEVLNLEGDIARFVSPQHIARVLAEREEKQRESARSSHMDGIVQRALANRKRAHAYLDGKTGLREAKGFSYAGQGSRESGGEGKLILPDRHEDGWE